jgi:hypothetical protein
MQVRRRLNPYLCGFTIGIGVVVLLILGETLFPSLDSLWDTHETWVDLAYYTLMLVGFVVWWNWERHRSLRFLGLIGILFVLHSIVFVFLLFNLNIHLSPFRYVFVFPVEVGIISIIIEKSDRHLRQLDRGHD